MRRSLVLFTFPFSLLCTQGSFGQSPGGPCHLNFDFNYQVDACDPFTVQFGGIGNDSLNYWWSFGDGTIITDYLNPVHSFSGPGNYIVRYAISNGTCADTLTKTINLSIIQENMILTPDTTI